MAATPRTTKTETDIEFQRVKATVLVAEQDDALRAADRAVEEAQTRRADAEAKKAAALREVARLDAEAEALAGACGPELAELAETRIAMRSTVAKASDALTALVAAVSELAEQNRRAGQLSDIARARGAAHERVPEAYQSGAMVNRVEGLRVPLADFLTGFAEQVK